MEARLVKGDEFWHVAITDQGEPVFDYNGSFDECVSWIWRLLGKRPKPEDASQPRLPEPPVSIYAEGPEG